MAATESDVLKPDHGARRKHFIFNDHHEALRESIHSVVVKELAPHAEEWEETTFPDLVFRRMGELGSSASPTPRSTAARAATTSATSCSPRRWCTRSAAGSAWASPSTPTWRRRRS